MRPQIGHLKRLVGSLVVLLVVHVLLLFFFVFFCSCSFSPFVTKKHKLQNIKTSTSSTPQAGSTPLSHQEDRRWWQRHQDLRIFGRESRHIHSLEDHQSCGAELRAGGPETKRNRSGNSKKQRKNNDVCRL